MGQGADIGINYLNLKPNIYNASDPTLLKTDIVGLKLTTGDNNQEIPMSNLSTPFRIQIPYPKTEALGSAVPFSCIYFNQTTKKWDDKGCYFAGFNINPDGSRFADCRCNHLTDFSFSNSFNVIGNSGFQYLGSVSSAFANADFSNLKGKDLGLLTFSPLCSDWYFCHKPLLHNLWLLHRRKVKGLTKNFGK